MKRSTKPINKIGRVGKLRRQGMNEAYKLYGEGPCQMCRRPNMNICPHHKQKRSDRGKEKPENLVMLCWGWAGACHDLVHNSYGEGSLFEKVKASTANIQNREFIQLNHPQEGS